MPGVFKPGTLPEFPVAGASPLDLPETAVGSAPRVTGAAPLMPATKIGAEGKMFKPNRPNRRLGARKPARMAFVPPQKKSAFGGK